MVTAVDMPIFRENCQAEVLLYSILTILERYLSNQNNNIISVPKAKMKNHGPNEIFKVMAVERFNYTLTLHLINSLGTLSAAITSLPCIQFQSLEKRYLSARGIFPKIGWYHNFFGDKANFGPMSWIIAHGPRPKRTIYGPYKNNYESF